MKLATFSYKDKSTPKLGVVTPSGLIDIEKAADKFGRPMPVRDVKSALTKGALVTNALQEMATLAEKADLIEPLLTVTFLPPILEPSKFLCVGKNTPDHRKELRANGMLLENPTEPTGFIKLVDVMVGHESVVKYPADVTELDYEPELVFVLGADAFRVGKNHAMSYVAGVTIFNDLTDRATQRREALSGTKFWTAKNMPGFAPIGPFILTLDEIADPFDLWMTCTVNGKLRMRENTNQYIYRIQDVIEHFSRFVPLKAGDLIAMGATKGVAVGQPNAKELYLRRGDVVEIAFEGKMSLRTTIAG